MVGFVSKDLKDKCVLNRPYSKVIGHRGCAGLAPENTLLGFQKAIDLGIDGIELDVHLTKDHHVIVHHDINLNPDITKNAQGQWIDPQANLSIRELTLSELQNYEVGEVKPGSYTAQYYPKMISAKNQKIPTLDQVLALIQKSQNKNLEILIEAKASPLPEDKFSDPDILIDLILCDLKASNLQHRARLLSFDFRSLALAKQAMPDLKTHYLTDPHWTLASVWLREFQNLSSEINFQQFIKCHGGDCWSPYFKDRDNNYLTMQQIKMAKAEGLEVIVWTPNRVEDLQAMIDLGVDGIITDRPDILLNLLKPTGDKTS
ncbi:MAG: glycerophosphodiester phosphodiesterase family protein [Janthinobacterium lividum]